MKHLLRAAALGALLLGGASIALAQDSGTASSTNSAISKVSYPIAELGGCDSRDACRLYCDDASHQSACFAFALKAGLMSKEKIDAAKIILKKQGPGGCASADECRAYCADSSHSDECLSFAQSHQVIASSTADLIRKFNAGQAPGACKSSTTCKMYCSDPSHRDECRSFAEENGLAPRMGSSSPMMPPRMGTSTSDMVHGILASTTPGQARGQELHDRAASSTPGFKGEAPRVSSTTVPGFRPLGSSTEPNRPASVKPAPPQPSKDDLGAAVLRGFMHLIGF